MKLVLALMMAMGVAITAYAAEPAKKDAAKPAEQNCVKKDKDGKCPPAPKGDKPTPKAPAKKEEAKK